MTEARGVFDSPLECLAFLSGSNDHRIVIGIDISANTRRFTVTGGNLQDSGSGRLDIPGTDDVREKMMNDLSGKEDPHYDTEIRQQRVIRLSEDGNIAAVAIVLWTARGKKCYFTIWHEVLKYVEKSWYLVLSETYEFEREDLPFPEHIDMERHLKLSRNGKCLIAFESVQPNKPVSPHSLVESALIVFLGAVS